MPRKAAPAPPREELLGPSRHGAQDAVHDPGPDAAAQRLDGIEDAAALPIEASDGHRIRIGTASWTDPTMTASGVFYPAGSDSAEERLTYYASRFPLVEVDATYYALPSRRTSELWVERTPPDFTFDIKAHALMTGQPTETRRLPKDLREALPADTAAKTRIYAKDLPDELRSAVWEWFLDGVEPLDRVRPARQRPPPVPALVLHLVRESRSRSSRRRSAWATFASPSSSGTRPGSTRRTSTGRCGSWPTTRSRS